MLAMSIVIIILLSTIFSAATAALSGISAARHFSASGWFSMALALYTVLFYVAVLVILRVRMRRTRSDIVEKGLVNIPSFNADKELFCTLPFMTSMGILFAMWVVATGAFLSEVVLRPTATSIDKANVALMIIGIFLVAAQAVRAFMRHSALKATAQYETAKNIKRFTTGDLPRPLVLSRKYSKDSISNPSPPPATLPQKIQPVTLMFAPPGLPESAVRPEPRYNGARTLVLVDPKVETGVNTSYHGSLSASSNGSFHTIGSPTLQ